jgi:hypothetical protein
LEIVMKKPLLLFVLLLLAALAGCNENRSLLVEHASLAASAMSAAA